MALTASEKQRVLDALDRMDRWTLNRVLNNVESFGNWLYDSGILEKVGEWVLHRLFDSLWSYFFGN